MQNGSKVLERVGDFDEATFEYEFPDGLVTLRFENCPDPLRRDDCKFSTVTPTITDRSEKTKGP
jgi:hypothetical protein